MGMRRSSRLGRAVALGLLVSTAACYMHVPLETPTPPPSTRVVASVTDSGTVALGNAIGPGAIEVEGLVAKTDVEAWELQLLRVDHRDGRSIAWNRELVSFPRGALANPTERRLDRTRSWLAAGFITVGAIVAASLFQLVGADDVSNPDPIPPH